MPRAYTEADFWRRVVREDPESFGIGCWWWVGATMRTRRPGHGGYGTIRMASIFAHPMQTAHRAAWMICVGEIPDGLHVLHRCDNRLCVNPRHLFLGTSQDNTDDMVAKGRHRPARLPGVTNPNAKLTPDVVRELRKRYRAGDIRQCDLAAQYGISRRTVIRIVNAQSYIPELAEDRATDVVEALR